jgi:hypothetical protein
METSLKIFGIPAEIQTNHLRNQEQTHLPLTKPCNIRIEYGTKAKKFDEDGSV